MNSSIYLKFTAQYVNGVIEKTYEANCPEKLKYLLTKTVMEQGILEVRSEEALQ